jgi:glutamate racemase
VTLGPAGAPLGVFDSGLGGLTVVRALLDALPEERIVYLGDTARVPYGTRSPETILRYARSCARELLRHDVKALVVACNTVSANALEFLRAELDLPVLGVIEPGARAAVRALESASGLERPGPIGVLGTASTIASGAYPRAVSQVSTRYEVLANPAPLLVPLVEEGWLEGEVPERVIQHYLEPLVAEGVSAVLLGCTHYPLLRPLIAKVLAALAGRPLPVVDSAEATADAVREWIRDERIPARAGDAEGRLRILVTDRPASFARVATRFLGEDAGAVEQIDLDPS